MQLSSQNIRSQGISLQGIWSPNICLQMLSMLSRLKLGGVILLACLASCPDGPLQAQEKANQSEKSLSTGPWISSLAWLSDSQLVATNPQGLLLRPAKIVTAIAEKPTELVSLAEAETSLWSLLSLPDGRVVVSDYRGSVLIGKGNEFEPFELDARWIRAMSTSPDSDQVLAGTEDGKLLLLSVSQKTELRRVDVDDTAVFAIAASPSKNQIAVACGNGKIKLFNWPSLEPIGEMSRSADAVWSLVYADDGKHLISGGANRRIQLWNVAERESVVSIATTSDWITKLIAIPNTDYIAAGCMDGRIVVVDQKTMREVHSWDAAPSAIWTLALSPNQKRLAIGTRKNGIIISDTAQWLSAAQAASSVAAEARPPAPER